MRCTHYQRCRQRALGYTRSGNVVHMLCGVCVTELVKMGVPSSMFKRF